MSLSWCYPLSNRTIYGFDNDEGFSLLQEKIGLLLKDDHLPPEVIDQIMNIIEDAETRRA